MAISEFDVYAGIDLGSDTVKISYAYDDGGLKTGKIVCSAASATAIPAVAYYDFDEKKWLFGEEVESVGDKSFMSVVKIKRLLSLASKRGNPVVAERNFRYYLEGNDFPKFYFPARRRASIDFEKTVRDGATFQAEGFTPATVCEQFFKYVYKVAYGRVAELAARCKKDDFVLIPAVVYPQHVGKSYIAELERLTETGFGTPPKTSLSMTKALCVYARITDRIKLNESALIFNIGEDRISVVKAGLFAKGLAVDGADGHNDPEYIGGNDVDDAVAHFLESGISRRESMGRPSSGEDGYMAEGSLNSKQYLFMKDIKTAKVIFGMPSYERGVFRNGVPVCVARDLYIQRNLTREDFCDCLGLNGGDGVAGRLLDYITREIERPVNRGIKKIFLTGGPVETYGLVEFIRRHIYAVYGIETLTFENDGEERENDGFNILAYEDALYAPALGCAIVALKGLEVQTVLALSYGLRLFLYEGDVPYLEILVNKGDVLPPDGAKFVIPKPYDPKSGSVQSKGLTTAYNSKNSAPMQIMSTTLTRKDISRRENAANIRYVTTTLGEHYLVCDPMNALMMGELAQFANLKKIANADGTENSGLIYYYYKNTRVRLVERVYAFIGVDIDGEGRSRPYCINDAVRNGNERVRIIYLWDVRRNGVLLKRAGDSELVYKRDVTFDFDIGEMTFN